MHSCLDLIPDDIERIFVAFSGGLDSSVLLHLVVSTLASRQIVPWHINHGLQESAGSMEAFCRDRARDYDLELKVDHLHLGALKTNIEARARERRYRLFEQHLSTRDCILTAHHADDQAETFLLNALRGAGPAGLRGIARRRVLGTAWLLRPLLSISRSQLESYASEHQLRWFNDPSNQDTDFDRNYLRREVVPLIQNRWPGFQKSLQTASSLQAECQVLMDDLARIDYESLDSETSALKTQLPIQGLQSLSHERQKNLIRYWIALNDYQTLTQKRLHELLNQLSSRADAVPEVRMPDYSIRIYDQKLFLVPVKTHTITAGSFDFGILPGIEIQQNNLSISRSKLFDQLKIMDTNQQLCIKYPAVDETGTDRHRLKRLFQKHRVPPWERAQVGQVYLDGKLEGILL